MTQTLIIVGGGGHARVVADALRSRPDGPGIAGFVDPDPDAVVPGLDHLGPDAVLATMGSVRLVLGVGTHQFSNPRPDVARRLDADRTEWVPVVHPSSSVSVDAVVGPGTVVLANAVVGPGARLGAHVIINSGAVVEHDVVVGDHSVVGPGALIGGGTRIGERVQVGIGATVRDHVVIGDDAIVAMGAVVVGSVAEATQVRGIPAKRTEEA